MKTIRCACLAAMFLGSWQTTILQAQVVFSWDWNNPSGGAYSSQFNWTSLLGGIPDNSSEIARFQLNGTYTVNVDADYTV